MPTFNSSMIDDDDSSDIVKVSPPTSSIPSMIDMPSENGTDYDSKPATSISAFDFGPTSTTPSSLSIDSSKSGEKTSSFVSRNALNEDQAMESSGTITETELGNEPIKFEKGIDINVKKEEGVPTDNQVIKDVHGVMEDTVKRVRERSNKMQRAARPYADKTRSFAEQRPILFTFLALWVTFSAIPLLFFFGFVVAGSLFIGGTALFVLCATIIGTVLIASACLIGTILFGATLLIPVLFLTTMLAIGALTILLSLFLIHRLYLHLSASTRQSASEGGNAKHKVTYKTISTGVKFWIGETVDRVLGVFPILKRWSDPLVNKVGGNQDIVGMYDEKSAEEGNWNEKPTKVYDWQRELFIGKEKQG